jgi:anhydro-N-acetylmuramic acid kinase
MTITAIGLMSGTSADGVSAVIVNFSGRTYKLISCIHHPYPPEITDKIRRSEKLSTAEVSLLNVELGEVFGEAAVKVMKKAHLVSSQIFCIGSHGQTVYHGPADSKRNSFQLADPATIAEKTRVTVVSHFRQKDIAAGGQGAPLIPFFDHYFYGDGPARAFQNIGGISNVTVVGKGILKPLAFDNGPGNSLMDAAVREITGGQESFDHHGQRAKHGTIDAAHVSKLVEDHPYFKQAPPKSTSLEMFGRKYLMEHFGKSLLTKPNDVLASLNFMTCLTIQESYRNFIFGKYPVDEVVISGGGAFNKTLVKKLECLFAPIPVTTIEKYGLPVQAKEPVAFAFFGVRCLQGKINHLPHVTGASRACVLGSVTSAA